MTPDKIAEEYLRWRFELMKAEAPAAPSAAHLIERALPWWERNPERFRTLVERLEKIQIGHDHSGGRPDRESEVRTVPALIVRGYVETEIFAQVLDLKIHDGKLHFRFEVAPAFAAGASAFEVTFISWPASRALICTPAYWSGEASYIVYTELPPDLARDWTALKETDRLPIRLILRFGT